jgi:5-(carboxyamino)imidazole ribonucleotide synthase
LCAAVTIEFENVPASSLDFLMRHVPVSPTGRCVAIAQNRLAEKRFMQACGVPVAPYLSLELPLKSQAASAAVDEALVRTVLPGILKTARLGYDGKGQISVATLSEVRAAHAALDHAVCVLEKRLPLAYEISVLVARGASGQVQVYPIAQNTHIQGVLAQTVAPAADVADAIDQQARQAALALATTLDYVGVLCVEFFVLEDGTLIANEMAPRPHNSGHYTIDACTVSQFEQQVRAMTGLPLGEARQHSPAVMLNLLGDIWFNDEASATPLMPPWERVLALEGAHLHLYGKTHARRGRKMGHLTLTAATPEQARQTAAQCAQWLRLPVSEDCDNV